MPNSSTAAGAPIEVDGFRRIKIKVGHDHPGIDLSRIEAVRRAIGADVTLAIDGNGKWDLPTCQRFCARAEAFDIHWFEEPLWYDDVAGACRARAQHVDSRCPGRAALHAPTPSPPSWTAGAVHYVQPDVTRLGGITEFLQVADAAHARRLPVAAHAGEMSQVHVHLSYAHPATSVLEYIPWIMDNFVEPIRVAGRLLRPSAGPGRRVHADRRRRSRASRRPLA